MKTFDLAEDVTEKLERAVFLRWADDQGDPHKLNAIADERTALTAELVALFGPVVKQLVEAEILTVDAGENSSFSESDATLKGVHVDDEFGIILVVG
jgi:hypothetical protein